MIQSKLRNSIQIMLIDNDKYVRESLSAFLENEEMRILIFRSGSEGLNSLKYQNIDVVISDYYLPDMDGISFLKKVNQLKTGIIRILMATIVTEELEKEVEQNGIDRFIEKPLTVTNLENIVSELACLKKNNPEI